MAIMNDGMALMAFGGPGSGYSTLQVMSLKDFGFHLLPGHTEFLGNQPGIVVLADN